MITNPATSVNSRQAAFLDYKGTTVADVWRHAPNPKYWRHGITIVRDWVGACRKLRQRDTLTIFVCIC